MCASGARRSSYKQCEKKEKKDTNRKQKENEF